MNNMIKKCLCGKIFYHKGEMCVSCRVSDEKYKEEQRSTKYFQKNKKKIPFKEAKRIINRVTFW